MRAKATPICVFSGSNAKQIFSNEIGIHRWQRVPPTETRGRVHTSSISVAILEDNQFKQVPVRPYEVRVERTRGSGAGGQHKNSTDSCIVMTHLSTGLKVVRDGRNQHENLELAYREMTRRVNEYYQTGHMEKDVELRRDQIGTGDRGEKRRTYRVKDGVVIDHLTNKTCQMKEMLKGKIILLK